ncbi:hypothetical protein [Stenotrophomonas maltophilia]|uniref:hypothetical protein n=1 Tax=Stenotrophomonas maltophilia TaxID=40324 RepID=UPI00201CB9CB|nr:hypothetical protein [Stenotrophomonas maltophilia]UQY95371.1 hypothetical protein LZ605_20000 [Stenotrophomonas maltophilia]
MATLSLGCRSVEMKVTADPVSERVIADMGAARLHLTADEAEKHAHTLLAAATQLRAAQQDAAA